MLNNDFIFFLRHINDFIFVWGEADLAANWWQNLSNGWQIVIAGTSVRNRWEKSGKKNPPQLSSRESKGDVTTVPSLSLSDIYAQHIKQIKKRKESMSSGLWTLSHAFVLCFLSSLFFLSLSPSNLPLWLIHAFVWRNSEYLHTQIKHTTQDVCRHQRWQRFEPMSCREPAKADR